MLQLSAHSPKKLSPLEIRGQDLGDVMVLVDSEEEEEQEEDAAVEEEEEEEEEGPERDEFPKEIHKHGHIHRVTALVNGNMGQMANGLQALQGKSYVFALGWVAGSLLGRQVSGLSLNLQKLFAQGARSDSTTGG